MLSPGIWSPTLRIRPRPFLSGRMERTGLITPALESTANVIVSTGFTEHGTRGEYVNITVLSTSHSTERSELEMSTYLTMKAQYWFDGHAYRINEKYPTKTNNHTFSDDLPYWEGFCTVPFSGYLAYVKAWKHPEWGWDYEERPLKFNLG